MNHFLFNDVKTKKLRALHILSNNRRLDTYPSVYNFLYCLGKRSVENEMWTSSDCSEFSHLLSRSPQPLFRAFQLSCKQIRRATRFDWVITYEPRDLVWYSILYLLKPELWRARHIHFSLEIPFWNGHKTRYLKDWLCHFALRRCQLLIIQDPVRLRAFRVFSTRPRKFIFIPNSLINELEPSTTCRVDSPKNNTKHKPRVIYSGSLDKWAIDYWLLDEMRKHPEVHFIISGGARDSNYVRGLINYSKSSGNIEWRVGWQSRTGLEQLIASCNIGVVYYSEAESNPNLENIGLSSGKMMRFLRLGLPILAQRLPGLEEIETKGLGYLFDKESFSFGLTNSIRLAQHLSDNSQRLEVPSEWQFQNCFAKNWETLKGT